MKNYLLYFAMFLLILTLPLMGGDEGVQWLWADNTFIPLILTFISLLCIGFYLYEAEKKERIREK